MRQATSSALKINDQVSKEVLRGRIRPLLCYALDSNYITDELWSLAEGSESPDFFEQIVNRFPYLALALWVRFFYEKGDGRDVWKCLPCENNEVKKRLQKYAKSRDWKNDLSEDGKWYEWMRTQCWVLAATDSGDKSELIRNNKRLSGYLREKECNPTLLLRDYVNQEWRQEELDQDKYLGIINEKYSEEVILVLESLSGELSSEKLEGNNWLSPIHKHSLRNRSFVKANWSFRGADIFLEFEGNIKSKVRLGDKTFRLSNRGLRLEEVLSAVSRDEIKRGIIYSYGNRFLSFDLSLPQLFLGKPQPKLVDTRLKGPISLGRKDRKDHKEVLIYLPDSFPEEDYALRFMGEDVSLVREDSCKYWRMYRAELLNVGEDRLLLIDRNSPGTSLYCFSESFGIVPSIYIEEGQIKSGVSSVDKKCCLYGEIASFRLEDAPKGISRLIWKLKRPDGVWNKPIYNNLHRQQPEFRFEAFSRDGLYELSCETPEGECLAGESIIYISDPSRLKSIRVENDNNSYKEGYCKHEVVLSGKSFELLLPVAPGEGRWQWYNKRDQLQEDPRDVAYTPTEWLKSSWELKLDITCLEYGRAQCDFGNLLFNKKPLNAIVADAKAMLDHDDFLDACFSRHDSAAPLYQFFDYNELVTVSYAGKPIFSYYNVPDSDFSKHLVMNGARKGSSSIHKIWYPYPICENSLLAKINGRDEILSKQSGNPYLFQHIINYGGLKSLKIEGEDIYPIVNRVIELPQRKERNLIKRMVNSIKYDQFNFFAMRGGDSWLQGEIERRKTKAEKDYFLKWLSYLNPSQCDLMKVNGSIDASASTFMLSILSFLLRDDDDFTGGLREICPSWCPRGDGIVVGIYSNKEIADYLERKRFWMSKGYAISYEEYIDIKDSAEILSLGSVEDLLEAVHYACVPCSGYSENQLDGNKDDVFDVYFNLCRAMSSWKNIAMDFDQVIQKLERYSDNNIKILLLKTIFSCRMHLRLSPEMSTCPLPLDPVSSKSSEAMIKRLLHIFDNPALIISFMMMTSVFEHYILTKNNESH